MTQKTNGQVSVHQMLSETQNYRSSLESLMEMGRALLTCPSLESNTAEAFQTNAEHILEEAGHQDDLQVVDGVAEPEARIELIMQDVLTPRLIEVEQIEKALAEKAEDSVDVPFTTRDAETSAALESLERKVEILELFGENVSNVKAFISMEGIDVDLVRPMVVKMVKRAGAGVALFGVSLESVEQTQVIGEMADAVNRIEALVEKASESATAMAEAARSEAAAIGADGQDRIGDLIERHRADNPSGAHLDEGTSTTTIDSGTLPKAGDEGTGDDPVNDLDADPAAAGDDLDTGTQDDSLADDAGGEDLDAPLEGGDNAEAPLESEELPEGEAPPVEDDPAAAGGENPDQPEGDDLAETPPDDAAQSEVPETPDVEEPAPTEGGEAPVESTEGTDGAEGEGEGLKPDEEEEEDDGVAKASIESQINPITIENASYRIGEEAIHIRAHVINMLSTLDQMAMLTETGKGALAAIQAKEGNDFVLTTDMFSERAAEVLVRHYDTWIAAAFRDNDANLRGLTILLS